MDKRERMRVFEYRATKLEIVYKENYFTMSGSEKGIAVFWYS
jgi:hypothetical protein